MISRSSNPGAWGKVESSDGLQLELHRDSLDGMSISIEFAGTGQVVDSLTNEECEAIMRATADMLGYQIGERYEV